MIAAWRAQAYLVEFVAAPAVQQLAVALWTQPVKTARGVLDGEFETNISLFSNDDGDSDEDVELGLPVIELPPFAHEGASATGEDVVTAGHAPPACCQCAAARAPQSPRR